jgi:hypothetical protein
MIKCYYVFKTYYGAYNCASPTLEQLKELEDESKTD